MPPLVICLLVAFSWFVLTQPQGQLAPMPVCLWHKSTRQKSSSTVRLLTSSLLRVVALDTVCHKPDIKDYCLSFVLFTVESCWRLFISLGVLFGEESSFPSGSHLTRTCCIFYAAVCPCPMLVHYVAKGSTLPGFVCNQHRGIEGSGLQCEEDSSQLATCSHIYTHTHIHKQF